MGPGTGDLVMSSMVSPDSILDKRRFVQANATFQGPGC